MSKMPRIVAVICIVAGAVLIVAGGVTYYMVHDELASEHITVSDDADYLAGDEVDGPFSAYSEAETIQKHALEIGEGKTYAQLPQDDPKRDTVMTASFLRASLFTSVVAFGVAALVMGLGVLFVLVGLGFLGLVRRFDERAAASPPATTAEPTVATA